MWSKPTSEAHKKFFSRQADKRRVFGWAQTFFQFAHFCLAIGFWISLFENGFNGIISPTWWLPRLFIYTIAGGVLLLLHKVFRTTWSTYWYDELDDDDETDSTIWLPLALFIVLLFCEQQGAQMLLQNRIAPVVELTPEKADQTLDSKLGAIESDFQKNKADLNTMYAERERTACAAIDRSVAQWQRKEVLSDNDRAFVNRNIEKLAAQRAKTVEAIRAEKLRDEQALSSETANEKNRWRMRHQSALDAIEVKNKTSKQVFDSKMAGSTRNSWLVSLAILVLVAGLGYVRVRINVKSGTLPERNFTAIDQHGGWSEQLAMVLSDAWKRNVLVFATWLHEWLSPAEVRTIDGTLITRESSYNSSTATASSPNPLEKLVEKMETLAARPDFDELLLKVRVKHGALPPEKLLAEIETAAAQNGSYLGKPEGGAKPGQPSAPIAHPTDDRQAAAKAALFARADEKTDTLDFDFSLPPRVTASAPVSQQTVLGGDELLLFFKQKLQADSANLLNQNGRHESIVARIEAWLKKAADAIENPAFEASRKGVIEFKNYLVSFEAATKLKRPEKGWTDFDRLTDAVEAKLEKEVSHG